MELIVTLNRLTLAPPAASLLAGVTLFRLMFLSTATPSIAAKKGTTAGKWVRIHSPTAKWSG